MDIKIATDQDKKTWDEVVFNSKLGTIFHSWNWLKLIEFHAKLSFMGLKVDAKLLPIMVFNGEELVGIFPIYHFKFPTINLFYSPPNFGLETRYLGPVTLETFGIRAIKQQEKEQQFISEVNHFLKNDFKANLITLNTVPAFYDPRPFIWDGYKITPSFTHVIDLNKNEDEIWGGFSKTLHQDIKKAIKIGIKIDRGGKEEYNAVLNIRDKRYKFPSIGEFYNNVFETFYPTNLNIFFAEVDGKLLTGTIILSFKKRLYAWIGFTRCEYKGTAPNELLFWEIMKWGIKNNYNELEIIGANTKTLDPFKRKFNGKLVENYVLEWESNYFKSLNKVYGSIVYFNKLIRRNPNP